MKRCLLVWLAVALGAGLFVTSCARRSEGERRPDASARFTVEDRVKQYSAAVASRTAQRFIDGGIEYPPQELAYIAFKDARVLEVYARSTSSDAWKYVMEYPILAASGDQGPKLQEGDRQVPEGLYRAAVLNPNSRFHLSIGCLAMGDRAAEDLFILAAHAGRENLRIIVAPTDFRITPHVAEPEARRWVHELYARIAVELRAFTRGEP